MATRPRRITLADVRRLALALPETEEGPCYGTSGFRVRGKLFARMKEDGATLVVMMGFDQREAVVKAMPEIFSVTPHYQGYPAVLVNLRTVPRAMLKDLLAEAWRRRAPRRSIRE